MTSLLRSNRRSPLIRVETLDRAIGEFADPAVDTVLSVYDNTHLNWEVDEAGNPRPMFERRVNRRFLPKVYSESGGIIASRRSVVTEAGRIGGNVRLLVLAPDEAVNIRTCHDWWLADRLVKRRRIVFHVIGNVDSGLGHVYCALMLARHLAEHEVMFAASRKDSLAIETITSNQHDVFQYDDDPIRCLRTFVRISS